MKNLSLIKNLLSVLFPEHCLACGQGGKTICGACANELPRAPRIDDWTIAALDYGDRRVKRAVWLFKYRNRRALGPIFARLLADLLAEDLAERKIMRNFSAPLLVPIPISAKRFRERGYNQCEILAEELSKSLGDSLKLQAKLLRKIRHTEQQAKTVNKRARLENLKGSFDVSKEKESMVRGRNIILLDDVVTTGATFAEASTILRKAGVKKILRVALAH